MLFSRSPVNANQWHDVAIISQIGQPISAIYGYNYLLLLLCFFCTRCTWNNFFSTLKLYKCNEVFFSYFINNMTRSHFCYYIQNGFIYCDISKRIMQTTLFYAKLLFSNNSNLFINISTCITFFSLFISHMQLNLWNTLSVRYSI